SEGWFQAKQVQPSAAVVTGRNEDPTGPVNILVKLQEGITPPTPLSLSMVSCHSRHS
ncbi:hypothetical protein KIPB_017318, partial [Kipferlia bialata]